MKTMNEIILTYSEGKIPLAEANQTLKELDCGLQLDPARNLLTAQ